MSFLAVGDNGLVLRLSDGGALQQEFTSNLNVNGVARTRRAWEQSERFVAVSDRGDTYHRLPGGGDWSRSPVDAAACHVQVFNLNAIAFAPGTLTGLAAGDDGHVALTLNAKNWIGQWVNTTRNLRAVCAVDKHTVWVAGDEGEIHRSSSVMIDPNKWTPMKTGVTKHLRGIAVGHRMVIAVGDDGMVVYHRSGNWGHTQITGKNLRAVAMSPSGKVIAVGDDGWIGIRKLAGTGSEASHWTEYTNVTSKHLRGVTAHDDDHWAIVGDATFLTSNDGGNQWHQHGGGTLNAVC
jgi:hypothetical protein